MRGRKNSSCNCVKYQKNVVIQLIYRYKQTKIYNYINILIIVRQ